MFSKLSVSDLVQRLARLAVGPPGRRPERLATRPPAPVEGGCGQCPACHEFVFLALSEGRFEAPCPLCGLMIDHLDPLGGGGDPAAEA
jgi:ribosomal protein S27AE